MGSADFDELSVDAQRVFAARCVVFARSLLAMLEITDPALGRFSEALWTELPAPAVTARLRSTVDESLSVLQDSQRSTMQGAFAQGAFYIAASACDWLLGEGGISEVARLMGDLLDEVGTQAALQARGLSVAAYEELEADVSVWTAPEAAWQAQFCDAARSLPLPALTAMAEDSSRALSTTLVQKIADVVAMDGRKD